MNRDDALVEMYRDIMSIKRNLATEPIGTTTGAGVSPAKRTVPGKRLRNWHRRYGQGMPLRAFVRGVADRLATTAGVEFGADGARIAQLWLAGKGARP